MNGEVPCLHGRLRPRGGANGTENTEVFLDMRSAVSDWGSVCTKFLAEEEPVDRREEGTGSDRRGIA